MYSKMSLTRLLIVIAITSVRSEEDLQDFDFSDPDEVLIATESRQYQTFVKPPVPPVVIIKPHGVTNSHRPQYNLDSLEQEQLEEFFGPSTKRTILSYKSAHKLRAKEGLIKDAVLRALERKDHVGKFAQILPIIRAMSGPQRVALASLVASQVSTPPGRQPLSLSQVRSMYGNSHNTSSNLMLPILLDMANLIRRAVRSGKEPREVREPSPSIQLLRRSDEIRGPPTHILRSDKIREFPTSQFLRRTNDDRRESQTYISRKPDELRDFPISQLHKRSDDDFSEIQQTHIVRRSDEVQDFPTAQLLRRSDDDITYLDDEPFETAPKETTTTTKAPRNRRIRPQRQQSPTPKPVRSRNSTTTTTTRKPTTTQKLRTTVKTEKPVQREEKLQNNTFTSTPNSIEDEDDDEYIDDILDDDIDTLDNTVEDDKNKTKLFLTTEPSTTTLKMKTLKSDNTSLDLATDSTNQTLAQDLPVAEKLRAFNRFIDRKNSNLIRRGTYPPKPQVARRTTAEPALNPISRRRPAPARKLPASEQAKCELFTNTVCLHAEDYPTDSIIQSIRRNKAAAGALLADFKDPGEGALDGVTAAQEAKYTADHYLTSNRRGDTANRDFASAGEAGFMCPSTVKYARPQRARATSGQWKYIVNTGEHTQTLRLEKCLKPKEACTYLTDNFKSKCVQVYNYHRLLTWDQQNGLHMDIFKVPTCCSCHIEGYSVSFPPLGHRVHETSSESFPGEDLSAEHGNGAFEQVQSSIHRPTKTPSFLKKPLDSFPSFTDGHNLIGGSPFVNAKINDDELSSSLGSISLSNSMDSYGNNYFPDSFNQASSIRNTKRPLERPSRNPSGQVSLDQGSLPSYLEPPTVSAPSFSFAKDSKYKLNNNQFKRGASRPQRRPIRKKIGGPDDLMPAETAQIENMESLEDFNNDPDESDQVNTNANIANSVNPKRPTIAPKLHAVTTEKIATAKPQDQTVKENTNSNGKRVNYNYHPIIDFFADEGRDGNESIDREDVQTFISPENEWKPINHPPSRSVQSTSLVGRKKY